MRHTTGHQHDVHGDHVHTSGFASTSSTKNIRRQLDIDAAPLTSSFQSILTQPQNTLNATLPTAPPAPTASTTSTASIASTKPPAPPAPTASTTPTALPSALAHLPKPTLQHSKQELIALVHAARASIVALQMPLKQKTEPTPILKKEHPSKEQELHVVVKPETYIEPNVIKLNAVIEKLFQENQKLKHTLAKEKAVSDTLVRSVTALKAQMAEQQNEQKELIELATSTRQAVVQQNTANGAFRRTKNSRGSRVPHDVY